jgi:hypothetical protein
MPESNPDPQNQPQQSPQNQAPTTAQAPQLSSPPTVDPKVSAELRMAQYQRDGQPIRPTRGDGGSKNG